MSERQLAKDDGQMMKSKSKSKSAIKNLLMFLPNMVKLLGRLLTDRRVPTIDKALFAAAIIYVIVPLDFIPDVFPFIGQVDDLYLVALTLLRLINHTDETVVRENWSGGGDIVSWRIRRRALHRYFCQKEFHGFFPTKLISLRQGNH